MDTLSETSLLATIVCYLPVKKKKSFDVEALQKACLARGIECFELFDASGASKLADINRKSPRMFLHKLTDSLRANDETLLNEVGKLLAGNPDLIVIDPLETIKHLLDRSVQYDLIRHCVQDLRGNGFDVSVSNLAACRKFIF